MQKLTKWGKRSVLYMGDHIQNDLIDAVKHWGWRTCAIIKELDEAIACHNSIPYRTSLSFYEQLYVLHSSASRQLPSDHPLVAKLERHISSLTRELMLHRHPKFGCVFKSGTKETIIAYQLLCFADIYTSQVENILSAPLGSTITPCRRLMAHDITITPNLFMT
jgi:5'-nucleotidase